MKPNPNPPTTIKPMAVARLRPNANNARTHSKKQIRQIARSIAMFGFTNPVLIGDDDEIIAGHGRVAAAKLIGLASVPAVRLSGLDAARRRAYALADNKLALNAGWNREKLATELHAFAGEEISVEATGFSLDEVAIVVAGAPASRRREPEPGKEPPHPDPPPSREQAHCEATENPVTRAADTWLLGRHRLLCTDPDDVTNLDRMLQEERVVFIAFDPAACDRIARHFRQLTGHDATLAETGHSFAEVAEQRAACPEVTPAAPRGQASRRSA